MHTYPMKKHKIRPGNSIKNMHCLEDHRVTDLSKSRVRSIKRLPKKAVDEIYMFIGALIWQ